MMTKGDGTRHSSWKNIGLPFDSNNEDKLGFSGYVVSTLLLA